jgi:hypothetical protein
MGDFPHFSLQPQARMLQNGQGIVSRRLESDDLQVPFSHVSLGICVDLACTQCARLCACGVRCEFVLKFKYYYYGLYLNY